MKDFAFYNWDGSPQGWRRLILMPRRLIRRVLRPIFFRQEAILHELQAEIDALRHANQALSARVDGLARQLDATSALGWDQVALSRRLASIEDRLAREKQGEKAIEPVERHVVPPRPHIAVAVRSTRDTSAFRQRPV